MIWLLDAGPLVAFFDKSDKYHGWAVEHWAHAPVPLATCEAVLAEATYILQEHARLSGDKVLALFERKVIVTPFRLEDHAGPVARLLAKYRDQKMQLADACLVQMSELHRDSCVFTLDKTDFGIYRRFERTVIPLIAPA